MTKSASPDWWADEAHDRDINAAVNIREAGLAIIAGADMLRLHEKDTGGPPEL